MATFLHNDSRRMYSWWWDSHINPKNSKWLQENLNDMDIRVKAMIKLIEEDADSFARRAEMYYKKRPELMKLVEEFYRAYRALAERYDHATKALRHAHRTMSEAFPNHVPLALPDESLSNNTLEVPKSLNVFDGIRLPEENENLSTKKGLKYFNEMINRQDVVARIRLPESTDVKGLNINEEDVEDVEDEEEITARVRLPEVETRNLNFEEEEEDSSDTKIYIDSSYSQPELMENHNVRHGVKHLQEQVSQLSSENQMLKTQKELESKNMDLSKAEVQNLRAAVSKLESEKDAAILQKQLSHESISVLENDISKVRNEIKMLNEEKEFVASKLSGAEKQCLALEKANQSLQLEQGELRKQLEELRLSLFKSNMKCEEAEASLKSNEHLYRQSNDKVILMTMEFQTFVENFKELGRSKVGLEVEVFKLKDLNLTLDEENMACALKLKHLEDELISLKEINDKLEVEIEIQSEEKKFIQQELEFLRDATNEMNLKNQTLTNEFKEAGLLIVSLEAHVKDLQYGHAEVKECCSKLEDDKLLLINKLKDMNSVYEKNLVLENSLSFTNVELEELRKNVEALEGSCLSLNTAVSTHVGEKTALAFEKEILAENVVKLSEKNMLLENSLDDANTELEGLRSKVRGLEESCQFLSHVNSDLVSKKNYLISEVENIQNSLANLEYTHSTLIEKHMSLAKEKDISLNKILNLENSLGVMQKEHESLIHSKNFSLASLERQLICLQEDTQLREAELEVEQQRCLSHMTEIYVLQRCLHDVSNSLIIEKQKYKSLVVSSKHQLSALQNHIHLLQEEKKIKDSKIEEEEQKFINSRLEVFILQKCLTEMKMENFTLLQECEKHLDASKCANELIKQLEERKLVQRENITVLTEHISKVRDGIQLLLESLNINNELMNAERGEVVLLPIILREIKNLLSSILNLHDEYQLICLEMSVFFSIFKQNGLEKFILIQDIKKLGLHSLALQQEHHLLFEEYEQLCYDASSTDLTNIIFKAKLESSICKLIDLSENMYKLREEMSALEEENSLMCVEAMTQENLCLLYRNLYAENMQQLNLLGGDVRSLLTAKSGLDEEISRSQERVRAVESENKKLKESLILLEDLNNRITILEFDLCTFSGFCEELILQVDAGEDLLKEKNMELYRVNDMLLSKQEELTKVCRELEASNKEVDEVKIMRSVIDNKIAVLLEGTSCKEKQIASINSKNRALTEVLNTFKVEIEVLKMKERDLSFELQEEKEEVDRCEKEIIELFSELQSSVVNATMFDEKMLELASQCEGLEISEIIIVENLREEIMLKDACAVELNMKLDNFENENEKLRNNLRVLSPLILSLRNGISHVKEHVCQLEELDECQENSADHHHENHETRTDNCDHSSMIGVLDMQNMISLVEALRKSVHAAKGRTMEIRLESAAKLESARSEIEELKLKNSSIQGETQGKEPSNIVKDIELDQVSSSFNMLTRIQSAESNDQIPKSWEPDVTVQSNSLSTIHDIEAVGEEPRSENHLSGPATEKLVGIYKTEEWGRRVFKRLAFDAEKLSILRSAAQELKSKMDKSPLRRNRQHFDSLRAKLKGAEEGISDLIDRNGELTAMVEFYFNSFNGEEMGHAERSQVFEQAHSASNSIELLELELQKIDYIFLKLQEEWQYYPARGVDRSRGVLLRDYLYGKKDRLRRKKGYFCGCIRPRTQDNY